jgi:CBS domain-containing protein
LGLVTDRDLAIEVLGNARDPSKTALATIMRKPVVIAREGEDIAQVIERMRIHGVRRIPVVDDDDGMVVGIVTLDDLIRVLVGEMHALIETEAKGERREQMARR